LRPDDIARIERETRVLERDFRMIENSHGRNTLNLVVAVGYLKKLLESAAVVKFLSRKHGDLLSEFQKLVETTDLDEVVDDDAAVGIDRWQGEHSSLQDKVLRRVHPPQPTLPHPHLRFRPPRQPPVPPAHPGASLEGHR